MNTQKIKSFLLNIYAYIFPIIGGFLGAMGGSIDGDKSYRRIFLPMLITSLAFGETGSILTLTILSMIGILSMGYGIPGEGDSGSFLGSFYASLFGQNSIWTNMLTRGTIGVFISLTLISIPIIKKNWLIYLLCGLGICIVNALISWRNFGSYHLFGKKLSWVETITWGLITLLAIIIIKK
jgi:hypothetical protein